MKQRSEGVTAKYTKHDLVCIKIMILLQQPGSWLCIQIIIELFLYQIFGCVSCPLVLVRVLVYFHFHLVSLVLAPFQIGYLRWCEMMIELEQSF